MFAEIGAVLLLTVCGIYDIRQKRIPMWTLIAGGAWALFCIVIQCLGYELPEQNSILQVLKDRLSAMLPGIIFLILSFLTEKKVGYGDGFLLMILGLMEGVLPVVFTCCMGLFLQSIIAVVLVVIKKVDRQTEIPFVPFLFVARIIYFWG